MIFRLVSELAWREFQQWDRYQSCLGEVRPLLAEDSAVEELTGLETQFRLPGEPAVASPPCWKTAVVVWVGVCLTVGVLNAVLRFRMAAWPA